MVKGFTGERSAIVQVYFVDVDRKNDQVTPIIDRAMTAIAKRGPVPGTTTATPVPAPRDLLDDLDEVLGNQPVRAADAPALPTRLAPR